MTDVYRTPVEAATVDYDLFTLPSGKRVTVLPLGDARSSLRARMPRTDAIEALSRFGLKLPSLATVQEIAKVGHRIEPVTLVYDAATAAKMRTRAFCERHDDACSRQLAASNWDGLTVVMNFGKWHIAGAAPGNNRLAGWSRRDGSLIQRGVADNHLGEAHSLFDYGTLVMGEAA